VGLESGSSDEPVPGRVRRHRPAPWYRRREAASCFNGHYDTVDVESMADPFSASGESRQLYAEARTT